MNIQALLKATSREEALRLLHSSLPNTEEPQELSAGLDACTDAVRKFHHAFNHPVADSPVNLTDERAIARSGWMLEELEEFTGAETVVDRADAMIDLIYFALGTLVEMGVKPGRLFEIVQAANMAKLHNGKPQYREDNKIVKPEGWVAPEPQIAAEIERQIADAKSPKTGATQTEEAPEVALWRGPAPTEKI